MFDSSQRKIIFFLIILLFFQISCKKETKTNKAHISLKAVIINDNASLRVDPYLYSAKITSLEKGTIVQILEKSKKKQWIGKNNKYWYKILTPEGIVGWVYGTSLSKKFENTDTAIEKYVESIMSSESKKIKSKLAGKWWSVDKNNDFTNYGIYIYPDGKYKSYQKGAKPIEGNYSIDYKQMMIIFLNGTHYNKNLYLLKSGTLYRLVDDKRKPKLKFIKIENYKNTDSSNN